MASARELLEQADALMQRNRRPPRGDEIPELTDAVPADALPHAMRIDTAASAPSARVTESVDDIPELTEAVEEIEAPSIQEYPDDPDELSRWLQEEEPKIPPRVREMPPAEAALEAPRIAVVDTSQMPDRLPDAMLRPEFRVVPGAEIPAESPASVTSAHWPLPGAVPDADEGPEEIFFEAAPEPAAEDLSPPQSALATEPEPVPTAEARETPIEPIEQIEQIEEIEPIGPTEPIEQIEPIEPIEQIEQIQPIEPIEQTEPIGPFEAVLPGGAGDPERWNALAEEIRMQVLQRIDIFTDTGLREQLTARLQPVVDRASADLVATINREVGQMLRAYVAEAIEREIEHWRHGGG